MEIPRSRTRSLQESKDPASPSQRAVWDAFARLTQEDFGDLASFAGHQLRAVHLPDSLGEDLVQQAMVAVAVGARDRSQGRHPRPVDVAQHPQFLNYLRGIISSLVESHRSRLENHYPHSTWEEWMPDDAAGEEGKANTKVDEEVAFHDLSDLFLRRLALRTPARLRQLLSAWEEQQFSSDNIPVVGRHRRLRAELRALAADVMRELISDGPQYPSPPPIILHRKFTNGKNYE